MQYFILGAAAISLECADCGYGQLLTTRTYCSSASAQLGIPVVLFFLAKISNRHLDGLISSLVNGDWDRKDLSMAISKIVRSHNDNIDIV
ncbi:hypothetical protein BYT27DRAFT_6440322 [Phlegmacium glaucopus]|nr:hypothetical protein BYT27DRAFT_6440322 [Phlegmacium glaucopus]